MLALFYSTILAPELDQRCQLRCWEREGHLTQKSFTSDLGDLESELLRSYMSHMMKSYIVIFRNHMKEPVIMRQMLKNATHIVTPTSQFPLAYPFSFPPS